MNAIVQSEVGKSSLWLKAFLLRGVGCNRINRGAENIEMVRIAHTKGAPERWMRQVEPVLVEYAKSSEAMIVQAVNNVKAAQIAKDDDDMINWLNKARSPGRAGNARRQAVRHGGVILVFCP